MNEAVRYLSSLFYSHAPIAKTLQTTLTEKEIGKIKDKTNFRKLQVRIEFSTLILKTAYSPSTYIIHETSPHILNMAAAFNANLFTNFDAKFTLSDKGFSPDSGIGVLPSLDFTKKVKSAFQIGKDFSGSDENGNRFLPDGQVVIVFEDHKGFATEICFYLEENTEQDINTLDISLVYAVLP